MFISYLQVVYADKYVSRNYLSCKLGKLLLSHCYLKLTTHSNSHEISAFTQQNIKDFLSCKYCQGSKGRKFVSAIFYGNMNIKGKQLETTFSVEYKKPRRSQTLASNRGLVLLMRNLLFIQNTQNFQQRNATKGLESFNWDTRTF